MAQNISNIFCYKKDTPEELIKVDIYDIKKDEK